jgi:hypothetical protein
MNAADWRRAALRAGLPPAGGVAAVAFNCGRDLAVTASVSEVHLGVGAREVT